MKISLFIPLLLTIAVMAIISGGCGNPPGLDDDAIRRADSVRMATDQGLRDLLCDLAANVYTAATADLATRVTEVTGAITDLRTTRTADNLERARMSWKLARRPWEFSEVGLLGPAKNQHTNTEIDSWPVDITTIRNILDGRDRIDAASLAREEGTARGFHAIEYLLWGADGKQVVEHITDREFDYMLAAATLMQSSVARLNITWQGTMAGDSAAYQWQFCHAGQPGSLYTSALAALRESINSSSSLASELQNSKMGISYHSPDDSYAESRFSNTSKDDFIANLDGIKAWYTGEYRERSVPITGLGISSLVVKKNPDLDARVRAAIDEAMWRVMAIQPSFGEAINSGNKGTIAGAISAVQRLEALLEGEVLPLFK
ncbi:MAG: imelysin family protein [Candidatus Kapaibacterium sp.]